MNRFAGRRKSVFAEQYDPEEDEEDENNKVIFPKTDEQRQRLSDSVKNILLFRALDPEQVNDLFLASAWFDTLIWLLNRSFLPTPPRSNISISFTDDN